MVCLQPVTKKQDKYSGDVYTNSIRAPTDYRSRVQLTEDKVIELEMESETVDHMKLRHFTGTNIVSHVPLFSPNEQFLFVISDSIILVYSTTTGEYVRQLSGANAKLVSMEIELHRENTIIACTVDGEVLRWMWNTGDLQFKSKIQLNQTNAEIVGFNILNFYAQSETACAFVTFKQKAKPVQWMIVDTSTGRKVPVLCKNLFFKNKIPLVTVGINNFKYVVVAQDFYVYFINYTTWQWTRLKNAHQVPVTCLRMHPTEEMVATGDETGKVFLWRQFMDKITVKTSLYHWHHTSVTSIAFSASGVSFYSSGMESVLVKWNVARPELRDFYARMCAIIHHIAVTPTNTKIAICTSDNGVQIMGNDNNVLCTVQEFTYITDDKTGRSKFPVGLRLNPRTNTLVLNGRAGHLQFFSAYTKKLLYNLDIVLQNAIPVETDKILYNTHVTKAAFNVDWMATGEVYNDEEHLPEVRLKFWHFEEKTQSYALNTNFEFPHEGGFRVMEFSNRYNSDNLYCATVGEDDIIKLWSVGESDNIYRKGKVWYCIGQTSYRNLPIESISFSQDCSLLAAGFGNTLCIYTIPQLALKVALTGNVGFGDSVQRAQVHLCNKEDANATEETVKQRHRILEQFSNMLEKKEDALLREIEQTSQKSVAQVKLKSSPLAKPTKAQKQYLFTKILQMNELNLFQKLLLYQKLGISCRVDKSRQANFITYIRETVDPVGLQEKCSRLHSRLHRINLRERFKAKYRLQQYIQLNRNYDMDITRNLVPVMSLLNINEKTKKSPLTNGITTTEADVQQGLTDTKHPLSKIVPEITYVQFAAGEHAHLVIVCTERRVLIWNLLTLRVQSVLKLSVQHLAFDAQTNLIAAFNRDHELYVFQANAPVPIYQCGNLPNLYGAVWMPHRQPKHRSVAVDWQSQAQLYFLTDKQEILYLSSTNNSTEDTTSSITFTSAASEPLRYSTFGTYAARQISEKQRTLQHTGPIIIGNTRKLAVKSLTGMCSYTMPPLSLLCGDFVKSLVNPAESIPSAVARKPLTNGVYQENGDVEMESEHEDDENPDEYALLSNKRKDILIKKEELDVARAKMSTANTTRSLTDQETLLHRLAAQQIDIEL